MKKLFMWIFILTIIDAAATAAGIKLGYIEEANPILRKIITQWPLYTGAAICLIVGVLLSVIYTAGSKIQWLIYAMSGVLFIKAAVVCLHVKPLLLFFMKMG